MPHFEITSLVCVGEKETNVHQTKIYVEENKSATKFPF